MSKASKLLKMINESSLSDADRKKMMDDLEKWFKEPISDYEYELKDDETLKQVHAASKLASNNGKEIIYTNYTLSYVHDLVNDVDPQDINMYATKTSTPLVRKLFGVRFFYLSNALFFFYDDESKANTKEWIEKVKSFIDSK